MPSQPSMSPECSKVMKLLESIEPHITRTSSLEALDEARVLILSMDRENQRLCLENSIDEMTGLLTKRRLYPEIKSLVANDRRSDQNNPYGSLIVMDINNMHQLNADFGHFGVDEILSKITHILLASLRDTDRAFRVGGDEFVIFFAGTDAKTAVKIVAERILKKLAEKPIRQISLEHQQMGDDYRQAIEISFCLGGAELPAELPDEDELHTAISETLKRADALEIMAKELSQSKKTAIAYEQANGSRMVKFI